MTKPTILILDDDHAFVDALAVYLQDHGYRPVPAYDIRSALERIQGNGMDLLIVDIHLPDGSGIDLVRRVQQASHPAPAILISGDDSPSVQQGALAAGARIFMVKPLPPEKLLTTIASILS
jgi:two-component system response regulator RegX3